MAVLNLLSAQLTPGVRNYPIDYLGKMRVAYWNLPAVAVAGDVLSTIDLVKLPPGRVRLLPYLSVLTISALGVGRIMDIGYKAFVKSDGTEEALSANALTNDKDVAAALAVSPISTVLKYDFFSRKGVTLYATIAGDTLPVAATASGMFVYVLE
jgi:hypothetical protein